MLYRHARRSLSSQTLTSRKGGREGVGRTWRRSKLSSKSVALVHRVHGGRSQHGTDVGGVARVETTDVVKDYGHQREVELSNT